MVDVGENMLVNQGEEAFEEGEKAKKTVKATKASMKEYAAATVFLVLRMEETLVPAMGTYLVASAMEVEGCKNKVLLRVERESEVVAVLRGARRVKVKEWVGWVSEPR